MINRKGLGKGLEALIPDFEMGVPDNKTQGISEIPLHEIEEKIDTLKSTGIKTGMDVSEGIKQLKKNCDTLLVIPNETLLELADNSTTVNQSFKLADSVLNQATKGISELINKPGLINLDFADVETVMKNMGDAIMGTGIAHGEEKAILVCPEYDYDVRKMVEGLMDLKSKAATLPYP